MRHRLQLIMILLLYLPNTARLQSILEYESGATIEVTTGADICADIVTINGTYIGDGTKCGILLPVELISFKGSYINDVVLLDWDTATEINNYGFYVEKKLQGSEWRTIGFISGSGNSNSPKSYSFSDKLPQCGIIHYRLKQIDFDGKFEYSEEIVINVDLPKSFSLEQNCPNPFNPSTVINYSLPSKEIVILKVYDIIGNEIVTLVNEEKEAGNYSINFNASNISSGVYVYQIIAGAFRDTKKLILMK